MTIDPDKAIVGGDGQAVANVIAGNCSDDVPKGYIDVTLRLARGLIPCILNDFWTVRRGITIERPEPEEVGGVVESRYIQYDYSPDEDITFVRVPWEPGTPVIVRKVKP